MSVVIETTLGDLTVDLFIQERPRACLNFLKLCKLKYYNFNLFHNIEHGFIAQTGDPSGIGDGGESIWGVIEDSHKRYFEAESIPKIKHSIPGLLSLVSLGKNLVGSQFFFTLGSDLISLDGIHCVIGEVVEGHEILRKLNDAIVDDKFRPYQDIRITHTVILEDPFDDPRGFQVPSRSPSPTPERLQNGRIGADEDIDDTDGKTAQEIHEMLQEREAKARATILEIVGDLPDADIAPPENVLFVCKLNPVTTDDDLEIIFSRFGKVKGCEVIRDKTSGDSLQYAFVEFEDKKSCENAFFKMDNVLIDDRRIHVDFSQSVAKVRWRGKGRGLVYEDGETNSKLDFNNLRGKQRRDDRRKRSPYKERRKSRSRSRSRNEQFRKPRNSDVNHRRDYQRNFRPPNRNYRNENQERDRRDQTSNRYERQYEGRDDYNRDRRNPTEYRPSRPFDRKHDNPERHTDERQTTSVVKKKRKKYHRRSSSSSSASSSAEETKKKKKKSKSTKRKKERKRKRRSSSSNTSEEITK